MNLIVWVRTECAGLINLISIKLSSVKYKRRESAQNLVKLLSYVKTKEKKREKEPEIKNKNSGSPDKDTKAMLKFVNQTEFSINPFYSGAI
jgi:hypothetical protein